MKKSLLDKLVYGTGIEDKDWNRVDPRKFELDMTNKEKLERIYEVVYVKDECWWVNFWDCTAYIKENNLDASKLKEAWKDKRQPIDNELEAIELLYDLIK